MTPPSFTLKNSVFGVFIVLIMCGAIAYPVYKFVTPSQGRSLAVNIHHNDQQIPEINVTALSTASLPIKKESTERVSSYNVHADNFPVDLNLKVNPASRTMTFDAEGLGPFSDVVIESLSDAKVVGTLQTKADWAGLLTAENSLGVDKDFLDGHKSYRIAVYGQIQNDATQENPYIIDVYMAPGGGQRGSSQVNQFTCSDSDLSLCDTGATNTKNDTFVDNYVVALMMMAEQLSAVMMQQVAVIGSFFDAKMQLETQRDFQRLNAEALKDYHPDDQMCRFGTFVRSVGQSEMKAVAEQQALNRVMMSSLTNQSGGLTSEGKITSVPSRLIQFRKVYCDVADNNDGLEYMCDHEQDLNPRTGNLGGAVLQRTNKDIDFTRTVGTPLSLEVNLTDDTLTADEEDVIALARNLYWPEPFSRTDPKKLRLRFANYMDARRLTAFQNIAHNSFSEIVSQKSAAILTNDSGPAFMKAMIKELGVTDATEIDEMVGESMSYYGQMEVLTKKIYQSPNFYTNLYTKPANLERISAALEAIDLMQQRDHYESTLREEMLSSLLLEEALTKQYGITQGLLSTESSSNKYK